MFEKEASFQALQQALVKAPVLALPDIEEVFVIETDASDMGIGTVLLQNEHPLAYLRKVLGPRVELYPRMRRNVWLF